VTGPAGGSGGTGDLRVGWLDRDAVTVRGPDSATYLQGQLSQDVAALPDGASTWSWVLQPAGKVDALVRVTRVGPDEFLLDVDGGFGGSLVARLARFKLRTKADIEQEGWRALRVLDRRPEEVDLVAPWADLVRFEVRADGSWGAAPAVDLWGPDVAVPDGATLVDAGALEVARIEAGVPKMGAELTERTIPAETGLVEGTVSFTKGCYTGQELVARIDSRGSNVPRHLRRLRSAVPLEVGADLVAGGKVVGAVTSAAATPDGWVGLGYVGRGVEPPADVTGPDGQAVRVVELPSGP
jgi:folate-binding protein YgfZ